MKKIAVLLLITGMFFYCSNSASAKAIGLKVIYNNMLGDYDDMQADNNLSGGLFFEYGKWGFESLTFRPGIDWVTIEGEAGGRSWEWATVIGVHADWYWFFMEKSKFSPFLGFGPAFNYLSMGDDSGAANDDDDSDVGIEGFGGCEFAVASNIAIMLELRLVFHDIADFDQQIFKPSLGVIFYF